MRLPMGHWVFIILSLIFSSWLMFSTFSYEGGSLLIASHAWSDFMNHTALIRSFSLGNNFPPQNPLFAGPPNHYHFLFYLLAGTLEKLGLRIDLALNLLSTLGFFSLLLTIFWFTKWLFKSTKVAWLSVIFFLFNGSFGFLSFFNEHTLSVNSLSQIIRNKDFSSFGPYDGQIVSAFWSLNIFTNQRHLALAFTISLLIILSLLVPALKGKNPSWKIIIPLGLILGGTFFLHLAVLMMTSAVILSFTIFFPKTRIYALTMLALAAVVTLPQYLYLQSGGSSYSLSFIPGYLISDNLSPLNFLTYWSYNLGLHFFLIPLGFLVASKNARKVFLAFLTAFIIGNIFQFSPEMAANHKFFNYFIIIGGMFSAYFLIYLWGKRPTLRPIVPILILFLTLTGIIDFFPIYNDYKITIPDYPINANVSWIIRNTPPEATILNSVYIYDPASLAGRKIFLGWPYFAWSAGYDSTARSQILREILTATDKGSACKLLKTQGIDYMEVDKTNLGNPDYPAASSLFYNGFQPVYTSQNGQFLIIDVHKSCQDN